MVEMLGFFLFATMLFVSVASATFRNRLKPRIHGGVQADIGQFPYQVSIRKCSLSPGNIMRTTPYCGGALISDWWVITASHCISGKHENQTDRIMVIGALHTYDGGLWYKMEKTIPHPNYNQYRHDIGLIKTNRQVYFSQNISPIALSKREVTIGEVALMSGWGADESMLAPLYLLYVSVNVINNEQCIVSHLPQYAERIYNTTICTMAREKVGACTGDSGGPLVQHKKLVGVISWGVPCALGVPDQHSRISSYLDWIKQHTGVVPS